MEEESSAEENPNTTTVNGKVYHWCVKHQAWMVHSIEECNLPEPSSQLAENREDDTTKL